MHEFKHTPDTNELEAFAETILGENDLSIVELGNIAMMHPQAWKVWTASRNYTLSEVLVGKEVSVDVSTGDHDLGHRIFCEVREVADAEDGFILLVDESYRNYDHVRDQNDAKIGSVVWRYIDRMNDPCSVDTAETILEQFTTEVGPLISGSIEHIQEQAMLSRKAKRTE
jgi:hypothetical protein